MSSACTIPNVVSCSKSDKMSSFSPVLLLGLELKLTIDIYLSYHGPGYYTTRTSDVALCEVSCEVSMVALSHMKA